MPRGPKLLRFSRADWLRFLAYWLLGSSVSFWVFFSVLKALLAPSLEHELVDLINRRVILVEALLKVSPSRQVPPGVRIQAAPAETGPHRSAPLESPFDAAVQQHLRDQHRFDRTLRTEGAPFGLGGYWVQLADQTTDGRQRPIWLHVPSPFDTLSFFWPLVRSLSLATGAMFALMLLLYRRVERPLSQLVEAMPVVVRDDVDLPLVPEQGLEPILLVARRINQLIEQHNGQAAAKRDLLRGLAHDLRSPLTRLVLRSQRLQDRPTPEALLATLPAWTADLDQLRSLADQLSALASHADPGGQWRSFSLDEACARLANSYPPGAVQLQVPRLLVHLHQELLQRSLTNLIDNALEYGKPPVTISAEGVGGGKGLRLVVDDEGLGVIDFEALATGVLPRSNDRERQRHQGIGLAIVRYFCRDHGGELQLSRSPRGGLRAVLLLPQAGGSGWVGGAGSNRDSAG